MYLHQLQLRKWTLKIVWIPCPSGRKTRRYLQCHTTNNSHTKNRPPTMVMASTPQAPTNKTATEQQQPDRQPRQQQHDNNNNIKTMQISLKRTRSPSPSSHVALSPRVLHVRTLCYTFLGVSWIVGRSTSIYQSPVHPSSCLSVRSVGLFGPWGGSSIRTKC